MPKTSKKKPAVQKMSLNPFKLFAQTWREYRAGFMRLWVVALVVAVPASLLRLTGQNGSADLSYIGSIGGLFMIIALVLIVLGKETKPGQSVMALYNQASASFLRYVGLSLLIAGLGLPLVVGFVLIILAVGSQLSWWSLLALASLVGIGIFTFMLVRFSLGAYVLLDQEVSAWQSLRLSWRMTRKRFWKLLACYVLILLVVVVLSGGTIQLASVVPFIRQNDFANAVISGLLISLLLPFLLLYTGKIYARLK